MQQLNEILPRRLTLDDRLADNHLPTDVGKSMDQSLAQVEELLKDKWAHLGESKKRDPGTPEQIEEQLYSRSVKAMNNVRDRIR